MTIIPSPPSFAEIEADRAATAADAHSAPARALASRAIPVHEADVAYTLALLDAAQAEVYAMCQGKRFRMCIPAQMTDSDVVLSTALSAARRILSSLTRKGLTREMRLPTTAEHVGEVQP